MESHPRRELNAEAAEPAQAEHGYEVARPRPAIPQRARTS
jgi:hypothetical protein